MLFTSGFVDEVMFSHDITRHIGDANKAQSDSPGDSTVANSDSSDRLIIL